MEYPLVDGVNFRPREALSPETLCAALAQTVEFLRRDDPSLRLRRFEDWIQHDGLMFERADVTFEDVLRWVQTPGALMSAMKDDDEVRVGVAPAPGRPGPPSGPWYLRFILAPDADHADLEGEFDLTLPTPAAGEYRREVVAASPFSFVEEDATIYYIRINAE
jgi:hypothetical protein